MCCKKVDSYKQRLNQQQLAESSSAAGSHHEACTAQARNPFSYLSACHTICITIQRGNARPCLSLRDLHQASMPPSQTTPPHAHPSHLFPSHTQSSTAQPNPTQHSTHQPIPISSHSIQSRSSIPSTATQSSCYPSFFPRPYIVLTTLAHAQAKA